MKTNQTSSESILDFPRHFRDVLSNFASGVVVVAGIADGKPAGLTCQSFFSVSLEPPLIAVSPSVKSGSWQKIAESGSFAVSILDAGQQALCMTFGRGGGHDKFAEAAWTAAPSGSPVLDGCLAWLDCSIEAVHPAGDHYMVLGRVGELAARDGGKPLVFYRSRFAKLTPHPKTPVPEWSAEDIWGGAPWIERSDLA